jgi:hypothetical protein
MLYFSICNNIRDLPFAASQGTDPAAVVHRRIPLSLVRGLQFPHWSLAVIGNISKRFCKYS